MQTQSTVSPWRLTAGVIAFALFVIICAEGVRAAGCYFDILNRSRSAACNPSYHGSQPLTNPSGRERDTNKPQQPLTQPKRVQS